MSTGNFPPLPSDSHPSLLIVDDDEIMRRSLIRMLEDENINVFEAVNGPHCLQICKKRNFDLILLDVKMPGGLSGIQTLQELKKLNPKQLVIIMTAFGTAQTAIESMKFGAYDYFLKSSEPEECLNLIKKAFHANQQMKNNVLFEVKNFTPSGEERIVGNSYKMQEVYKLVGQVAEKDLCVLLQGEFGTGKELVARAIYHNSARKNQTYLAVNCATTPERLLESELFGHEKGAFTDAENLRIGKFEQCNGGTIFLDEIGDMSLSTQSKILRVLGEKEINRLGSDTPISTDIRLIVATNHDLKKSIKNGTFREDLFYRLNEFTIHLPPLRERKEDISELISYFLSRANELEKKNIIGIHPLALEKLIRYDWPGNVGELENVIKQASVLCKGHYLLPENLPSLPTADSELPEKPFPKSFQTLMDEVYKQCLILAKNGQSVVSLVEKEFIKKALSESEGNLEKASNILGIDPESLREKMVQYEV